MRSAAVQMNQRYLRNLVGGVVLTALLFTAYAGQSSNDEALIYAQVLNELVGGLPKEATLLVVVSRDSMSMNEAYHAIGQPGPTSLEEDLVWRVTKAKNKTLEDFVSKNNSTHQVQFADASIRMQLRPLLVSKGDIDSVLADGDAEGWERFAKRYPNARYLIHFSPIGFDDSADEALVYMHRSCVGLCGSGHLFLLRKRGDEWSIVQVHQFWVS